MNIFYRAPFTLTALLTLSISVQATSEIDPYAALQRIQHNYNTVNNDCRDATHVRRGHYYCSGVLIRGTEDGNFNPWESNPNATRGSVSYSWIREDIGTDHLYKKQGFILRSPVDDITLGRPANSSGWMCLFPFDGWTGAANRGMNGCDSITPELAAEAGLPFTLVPPRKITDNNYNFGSCGKVEITTAVQWLAYFKRRGSALWNQCSWDIEDQDGWNAAVTIHQTPIAPPYPGDLDASWYTAGHMELLKRTGTTPGGTVAHIDAFYYDPRDSASLTAAKNFQRKLREAGYSAPILRIDFSAASQNRFSYSPADQGETFTNLCPSGYIQSGEWVLRYDPGTQKNEWTLVVTPTACGREIRENGTNQEYAELVSKFSADDHWKQNDGGGMRRQLVCHLVIARNKATWNLEPFRPDVTHEQSINDGCNSINTR